MSTPSTVKEMFDIIEKPESLRELWKNVAFSKAEIQVKIGDSDRLILMPTNEVSNNLLCKVIPELDLSKLNNQEVIGQFFMSGDKYFFKTPCIYANSQISIPVKTALYKLQRRQTFRLRVPDVFISQFNVTELNTKPQNAQLKIWDLSSGGCCLLVEKDLALSTNDKIKAQLILGRRDPLMIDGFIRHVRSEINDGKKSTYIGVQFSPISSALDSQLFTVMMELSRQYLRG